MTVSDSWIADEQLPAWPGLKVVRKTDPDYGMTDDEIRDRNEFIRCYLMSEHQLLMFIPAPATENEFFIVDCSVHDADYSAFNTHDFQRMRRPFDRHGYAMKKILERVRDLAILHSCISYREGRQETRQRFEAFIDFEFRDRLNYLASMHSLAPDPDRKQALKSRIMTLNRQILQCRRVWEHYAPRDL